MEFRVLFLFDPFETRKSVADGLPNTQCRKIIALMNVMTQPNLSQDLREQIETALQSAVQFEAGCPQRLSEAIQYSLLAPGKRLRPQLVLLAAQSCGGQISEAMPAAVAVEMIHAYSLVHDDLPAMDDDLSLIHI